MTARLLRLTSSFMRGEDIREVQRLLAIDADGVFGPGTEKAVRAWQQSHGLQVDGKVGPVTLASIRAGDASPLPTKGILLPPGFIKAGFPKCLDPDAWQAAFDAAFTAMPYFNKDGMSCIFAKVNTEAKRLTRWDEDLYYTTVEQVVNMHGGRAGNDPASLLRNPKKLGDQVYAHLGGYPGRGLGTIQLTGLANQTAFAKWKGMSLEEARTYMLTIPGAAETAPWYIWHFGAVPAANAGDMRAILRVVAGVNDEKLTKLWVRIHGDQQMADRKRFRALLG